MRAVAKRRRRRQRNLRNALAQLGGDIAARLAQHVDGREVLREYDDDAFGMALAGALGVQLFWRAWWLNPQVGEEVRDLRSHGRVEHS